MGGDSEKTNREIAKILLAKLNLKEEMIEYVQDRPGHDFRYAIDSNKIKKELGYKIETSFDEGIDKTIEWYKSNIWKY